MTDLILVRHAQTVANVAGRWEGWTDGELTPLGREQAEATAQRLTAHSAEVAALHTSPLLRALETARVIGAALGLPPVVADDLKEINFGQLDGVSPEEMERHHPALHARWRNRDDLGFTWPGGEQRAAFLRRVASACDRILSLHPRETALIVSHGGTMRVLLAHLLPSKLSEWWNYSLGNCSITCISAAEDSAAAQLLTLDDRAHLQAIDRGQSSGRQT